MPMRLNADFYKKVVIRPEDYHWVESPVAGIERMMLDRIGDEIARATSLVRYAPDSEFPAHRHGGGEEIFVLEGEFADEHGHYPAGTYLRNPIGTGHAPKVGTDGAVIFVKLHQFNPRDTRQIVIDTRVQSWQPGPLDGLSIQLLHAFGTESVALVKWAPGTSLDLQTHEGGEEVLVVEGSFHDEFGSYPKGSWIRSPQGSQHRAFTRNQGALLLVKTGHLHDDRAEV